MSTVTISYTSGVDEGGANAWTSPNNAFDKVNDTYASILALLAGNTTNYLKGTAHDNVLFKGVISKVEIGLEGYTNEPEGDARGIPHFSGSTSGDFYTLVIGAVDDDTIAWADVTDDDEAPSPWTWTDVDNLDLRCYLKNDGFPPVDRYVYFDQLYLKVTYEVSSSSSSSSESSSSSSSSESSSSSSESSESSSSSSESSSSSSSSESSSSSSESSSSSSESSSSSSSSESSSSSSSSESSSSSSSESSSSSSSIPSGAVCWGHDTGVQEDNVRDFLGNWSGTGTIGGAGDNETLTYNISESEESETWYLGSGTAKIMLDKYQAGSGPTPTIEYKTGNSKANCEADSWNVIGKDVSFTSQGWVKIRLSR